MERDRADALSELPCPTCGLLLPTRVLADPVTIIVIGVCPTDGTAELSRVKLELLPADVEPYPSGTSRPGAVAYKPGVGCGRRLDEAAWCELPPGHEEPHAG